LWWQINRVLHMKECTFRCPVPLVCLWWNLSSFLHCREPEYLPKQNCFAFPSLLLILLAFPWNGHNCFPYFKIICIGLFMHAVINHTKYWSCQVGKYCFQLKPFFSVDMPDTADGKLMFWINFTKTNWVGLKLMSLEVWHCSK
jgi:hypothetical protein